jgi:demethylmenaquinone methyltransferase/2-methoxy-6-polyprenyl-1,4-benzoquinol methylase
MSFDRDYETILDRLKLSKGDNLLDLAGGTGEFVAELINRGVIRKEDGYIIDLSESMLEQAYERELENIRHGDTTDLPYEDNKFDGVFAGDAIHHMGEPVRVFEEVTRVLAPDGRFVIEEFDPSTFVGKLLFYLERLTGMGSQFKTPETLQSLVGTAGFDDVQVLQDNFVYYVLAKK